MPHDPRHRCEGNGWTRPNARRIAEDPRRRRPTERLPIDACLDRRSAALQVRRVHAACPTDGGRARCASAVPVEPEVSATAYVPLWLRRPAGVRAPGWLRT